MKRAPSSLDVATKLFRGLADPSRLSILDALQLGAMNVTQVMRMTGLSQPNASAHLDCLWCCGLVDREARGRATVYRIKSRKLERLLRAAAALLEDVEDRIAECGRYGGRT